MRINQQKGGRLDIRVKEGWQRKTWIYVCVDVFEVRVRFFREQTNKSFEMESFAQMSCQNTFQHINHFKDAF